MTALEEEQLTRVSKEAVPICLEKCLGNVAVHNWNAEIQCDILEVCLPNLYKKQSTAAAHSSSFMLQMFHQLVTPEHAIQWALRRSGATASVLM